MQLEEFIMFKKKEKKCECNPCKCKGKCPMRDLLKPYIWLWKILTGGK